MTCNLLFFAALNHRLSNKNAHKDAGPSSAPVLSTTPSRNFKEIKSQQIPRDVNDADGNNSASTAFTEGYQLKDNIVSQRPLLIKNPVLDKETDALSTLRSHSAISKETQDQKGTTVTFAKDPKVYVLSSTRLPDTTSVILTKAEELAKTVNPLPNTTMHNQTSLILKNGTIERSGTKVNIQAAKPPAEHGAKNNATSNLSPNPGLNHTVSTKLPFANSRESVTVTQISSVKLKTHINPINRSKQIGAIKDLRVSQFTSQNPGFQTSSNKPMHLNHTSPFRPLLKPHRGESQTPLSSTTLSKPIFKTPTLPTKVTLPSKSPTLQYIDETQQVSSLQPTGELLEPQVENSVSELTIKPSQFQTKVPPSPFTLLQSATSYHNFPVKTLSTQTEGQNKISQTPTSVTPHIYPWSQTPVQTKKPMTKTAQLRQTQIPITRLSSASRSAQKLTMGKDFTLHMSQTISETLSPTYASIPSVSPSILVSPEQLSAAVPVSSIPSHSTTSLAMSSVQTFSPPPSKAQTAARLPNLPTPSPISTPPHSTSAPLPATASSAWPPLSSSQSPTHTLSISASSSSLRPPKLSSSVTSSYASLLSSFTISPFSLSINSASPSSSFSSSSISTSTSSSSVSSQDSASPSFSSSESSPSSNFSETTSRHHRLSPVPHLSTNHHLTSTSPNLTSQPPTKKLLIHATSLEPDPKPNVPTPGILHSPPKVHPNLDQNLKPNSDNKAKPNPAQIDNNLKDPSSTPEIPVMDGKYPDIIPRNSTWILGMLLGCSACLGMIAVVGLRYMYHQVCGKRTAVTLNDREREYGGGERGLIHVQECGDLVRVRRIRDNSYVFLAEYDILASAGD